jgi:hypothetical protein
MNCSWLGHMKENSSLSFVSTHHGKRTWPSSTLASRHRGRAIQKKPSYHRILNNNKKPVIQLHQKCLIAFLVSWNRWLEKFEAITTPEKLTIENDDEKKKRGEKTGYSARENSTHILVALPVQAFFVKIYDNVRGPGIGLLRWHEIHFVELFPKICERREYKETKKRVWRTKKKQFGITSVIFIPANFLRGFLR